MDTRRDFIYVEDLIDLVELAVDGRGDGGAYHASSGSDYSIKELFDATVAALGIELDEEVEVRDRNPDDAFTILLDPSRTQEEFGWEPKTPLEEGVAAAVDVLPRLRHRGDVHAPEDGRREAAGAVSVASELGPRRRRRRLRRREPRARGCSSAAPTAWSSSTTSSRPSARTCPTTRASRSSRARSPTTPCSAELDDDFDYIFHLATFHGNQSSIGGPARRPRAQPDHDAEAATST